MLGQPLPSPAITSLHPVHTTDTPNFPVLEDFSPERQGREPGNFEKMAVTMKQMSLIIAALGALSFIFGVVAENKKPASGTAVTMKDIVICNYPKDPTVALGICSVVFLVAASVVGYLSLFYPYKGKPVPQAALFRNTGFSVFFNIALGLTGLALAMLLWPTITEQLHQSRKVHHNLQTDCPTAKTGLLGGGAFLSLDSALFWLVSLMLADNAREDYFDETDVTGERVSNQSDDYEPDNLVKGSV